MEIPCERFSQPPLFCVSLRGMVFVSTLVAVGREGTAFAGRSLRNSPRADYQVMGTSGIEKDDAGYCAKMDRARHSLFLTSAAVTISGLNWYSLFYQEGVPWTYWAACVKVPGQANRPDLIEASGDVPLIPTLSLRQLGCSSADALAIRWCWVSFTSHFTDILLLSASRLTAWLKYSRT